jgi:SAM-dependent methyltransferase
MTQAVEDPALWINLGSGPVQTPGWVSLDGSLQALFSGRPRLAAIAGRLTGRPVGQWPAGIVRADLRRPLPFADASAAVIYSSHTLEHLHRDDAIRALCEARRVLRPGGICRVVVPDVGAIVGWYLEKAASADPEGASDQLMSMLLLRSPQPAGGVGPLAWYRRMTDYASHKWMYDAPGLVRLFRDAGFEAPRVCGHLESAIDVARLAEVERADRVVGGAGICVEDRR